MNTETNNAAVAQLRATAAAREAAGDVDGGIRAIQMIHAMEHGACEGAADVDDSPICRGTGVAPRRGYVDGEYIEAVWCDACAATAGLVPLRDGREPLRLPDTVRYTCTPYVHGILLGDLRIIDVYNGAPVIRGTVIEGAEYAYLMGHTSRRDIAGTTRTIYGVGQDELDRGHIRRGSS